MRCSTVFVTQRMFFIVIFVWRIPVRRVLALRLPGFSGNFSKRIPLPCAVSILCAAESGGGASVYGVWKCISSGKEVVRLKYVSAVVMAAES